MDKKYNKGFLDGMDWVVRNILNHGLRETLRRMDVEESKLIKEIENVE